MPNLHPNHLSPPASLNSKPNDKKQEKVENVLDRTSKKMLVLAAWKETYFAPAGVGVPDTRGSQTGAADGPWRNNQAQEAPAKRS